MRYEPNGYTLRRARLVTAALATAALIALSDSTQAQRTDPPPLDVPYVPTPPEVVQRMLAIANVHAGDVVIDLGSGDGRIAIAAAHLGARALGIDIDPERIREAQDNARKTGLRDKVRFERQNLFDTRLSDATVVTMYLLTKVNLDLRPRLLAELKPGTRIVSHSFDMGGWKADVHSEIGHRQVYMWIVPAKASGRWVGQAGTDRLNLDLQQEFQYLKGSAHIAGRELDVREGWVRGTEVHLTLSDGAKLSARVDGDRMHALPTDPGDKPAISWHASRQS